MKLQAKRAVPGRPHLRHHPGTVLLIASLDYVGDGTPRDLS